MKKTEYQTAQVIDEVDLQILEALKENARISLKSLAEKTYLSSTAVGARIEKLERAGIIEGYHAKINPRAFGVGIKVSSASKASIPNTNPIAGGSHSGKRASAAISAAGKMSDQIDAAIITPEANPSKNFSIFEFN